MLQSLHIQNFALIEDLHIVFAEGVTIFTGETGAGKSILLDAIGMTMYTRVFLYYFVSFSAAAIIAAAM